MSTKKLPRATWIRLVFACAVTCACVWTASSAWSQEEPPADPPPAAEPAKPEPPAAEDPPPKVTPSKLPWEKGAPLRGPANLQGFRNAREMLKFLGVESSEFEGFFHGEPLMPAEEDVLFKLMRLFPRLGLDDLHRWRKNEVDWTAVASQPNEFRGEIIRLKGRAKSLKKVPLLPELVDRFEYEHYYRVEVEIQDSPFKALVCLRTVPGAWKTDDEAVTPLDEPIAADAMFLKLGEDVGDSPQVVFVAQRLSWFPDRENKELNVGPTQLQLARLGFDVSLLTELHDVNFQPLGPGDREPFYGLLDALGRAKPGELQGAALDEAGLIALLQDLKPPHGEPVRVAGNARKIVKIRVEDADIRQRFGIDHYYEVDFFIPLKRAVKFRRSAKDVDPPTYTNFPATLCIRELPPGITEGENLRQGLEAEAVFFKIWTYQAGFAKQHGQSSQAAPMFLARTFTPVDSTNRPVLTRTDIAVAGGLLASLVLLGVIVWFASRRHTPGTGADLVTGSTPVKISVPEE